MNKTLLAFLIAAAMTILVFGFVRAQFIPLPIPVKVLTTGDPSNILVKVTNTYTGETITGYTNPSGDFLYDWANSQYKYNYGQVFEVEMMGQKQYFTYQGSPAPILYFTLNLPPAPQPPVTICPEPQTCPAPQVCPEPAVCPAPPVCPVPAPDYASAWLLITGLLVGAGAGIAATRNMIFGKYGTGIKVYTKTDGTISTLHKHPGITGYHNPSTSHKYAYTRHQQGELLPAFAWNSTTQRYEYAGGGSNA